MRAHPGVLGVLLVANLGVPASAESSKADQPPNIILVLADDIGAKELGCYGNTQHKTPNLDHLAAQGVRFETCYAMPLCTPTRVALMTGQYGFRTGYFHMSGQPLTPKPTSAEHSIGDKFTHADLLKQQGYTTAMAGKWQLTGKIPNLINECGFDTYRMWAYTHNLPEGVEHTGGFEGGGRTSRYWHPCIVENGRYLPTRPDDYGPDLFADFLLAFAKEQHARQKPFFLYFTMPLTHGPHVETPDPDHPGKRRPAGYATNVEYLDHLMGRFVQTLDESGLNQNTVLIFVGDNGTAGSGKGTVSELGARVPLIIRGPGLAKPGVVSRSLVDITDIFATLADLAKAPIPANHPTDGSSLVPVLRGQGDQHRDWIFSFLGHGRILRTDRWLLEDPGQGSPQRLYDCGEHRDGRGYVDKSTSIDEDAVAARARLNALLVKLPGPEGHPDLIPQNPNAAGKKAQVQKKAQAKAKRQAARKKAADPCH